MDPGGVHHKIHHKIAELMSPCLIFACVQVSRKRPALAIANEMKHLLLGTLLGVNDDLDLMTEEIPHFQLSI